MKNLIIIIVVLLQGIAAVLRADDARFRFQRMEGCTGIPTQISDGKGKITTVVLAKDSDPAAMAILRALISQQGVWGSFAPTKDPRGITWDQGIVLIGSFISETKRTPYVLHGADPEPYKEFKVNGITIEFPFARFVETNEASVDSPLVVEFHLELRSLIPKGLVVNGKHLDLRKYESKSKCDQGNTDNDSQPGRQHTSGVKPK